MQHVSNDHPAPRSTDAEEIFELCRDVGRDRRDSPVTPRTLDQPFTISPNSSCFQSDPGQNFVPSVRQDKAGTAFPLNACGTRHSCSAGLRSFMYMATPFRLRATRIPEFRMADHSPWPYQRTLHPQGFEADVWPLLSCTSAFGFRVGNWSSRSRLPFSLSAWA